MQIGKTFDFFPLKLILNCGRLGILSHHAHAVLPYGMIEEFARPSECLKRQLKHLLLNVDCFFYKENYEKLENHLTSVGIIKFQFFC
jgi:hypothetical protein